MADQGPAGLPPVTFTPRRLLLVGTGAISAAMLPYWVRWLKLVLPELETRIVITRGAERFVTRMALSAINASEAVLDEWPDTPVVKAPHVEWAQWAEAVAVYPATVDFLSRFAAGRGILPPCSRCSAPPPRSASLPHCRRAPCTTR